MAETYEAVEKERNRLRIENVDLKAKSVIKYDIFRICKNCNKEYKVPLVNVGNGLNNMLCNFTDCPNCKMRDDLWILIKPQKAD